MVAILPRVESEDILFPQNAFSFEIDVIILPLLEKLKEKRDDPLQINQLIDLLETHLQHLAKSYSVVGNLSAAYQRLTPVEKLVSTLVRQGLATKDIASALTISPGTVSIHRKHIRKKFDLDHKKTNFYSYLNSLS